jgi:hypothetical protein
VLTSGTRFKGVPIVFVLDCVVILVLLKKNLKQTVTSRIAQGGTDIPAGIGFGNLETNYDVNRSRFSTTRGNSLPRR